MTLPRSRILTAVPRTWQTYLEIAKALRVLAARHDGGEPPRQIHVAPPLNTRDLAAEIILEIFHELRKANFNLDEPRVPAGNPDGGQWTMEGGVVPSRTSGAVLSDVSPDNNWTPGAQYAANGPPGIGHNQGPPLEEPPKIPPRVLATKQAINNFLKAAATWLEDASGVDKRAAALFFVGLMATGWLADKYLPYIVTYQDPPRTLEELQQAASLPKIEYYNDHHLVEQTAAENDGFPRSVIDAPENIVRIPTLKHWLITGWYQIPNPDFDWLSPREYLRGKSWEERARVGKLALIEFGVLQP
ncbi:MAG TPA: hypothetical protein VGH13_24865 [Xanthobacteraceae bacterium]|jgi:hypothetical protein